jgi:hypothetical protein
MKDSVVLEVKNKLKEYIENWNSIKGVKPENESEFVSLFCDFLFEADLYMEFDGDGAYFGKQISIHENSYFSDSVFNFEIAYSNENISIYSGNHNGFWVPEYVSMTSEHKDFSNLKNSIMYFIKNKMWIE